MKSEHSAFDGASMRISTGKLVAIFLAALVARLWFFGGLLTRLGHEKLLIATNDVGQYHAAAKMISDNFDFSHRAVQIFGPGYPSFLAFMGGAFALDPVLLSLVQVTLGAFNSVLLALYAYRLTKNETLALVAGALNALSINSIGLSGILLSGTLFFALILSALYLLENGLDTRKYKWFVISGILFSLALLTRSVGQLFPLLVFLLVLVRFYPLRIKPFGEFVGRLSGPLIMLLIPGAVALSWSTYNHFRYDFFEVAISTPHGLSKGVALIRSERLGIPYEVANRQLFDELYKQEAYLESGYNRALSTYTRTALIQEFLNYPFSSAWTLAGNAFENMTVDSGKDLLGGRRAIGFKAFVIRLIEYPGMKYRTLALALIGLMIMIGRKQYKLATSLTLICAYFGATSAFTLDQGARIFYPAQIGWSMLVATTLTVGFQFAAQMYHSKLRRILLRKP